MHEPDERLASVSRIRRGGEWPRDVEEELAQKSKYPREITIKIEDTPYILNYRKSRWCRMAMGDGCVRTRDLFCWVVLNKQRLGALHFVEFEPDTLIDN